MLCTRPFILFVVTIWALAATARPARAQTAQPGGCNLKWQAISADAINLGSAHYRLAGNAQVDCNDAQLFADDIDYFPDADRMRATGNVVFVTNNNRISADRMEFNTKTKTGTFYNAFGIASLENRGIDRSLFGTQEPDAYFWGDTIEKMGPRTYKITHGGFTTCVQPTPRWEFVSNSVTLVLEDHAKLKNAILMVKGVPLFYIPEMYYPINKEDRATGFLIPIYGSSSIKGQSITEPFFWAISRSQDATLTYSFFSKTGQAFGGEYRYIQAPGSQGGATVSVLREHATTYPQPDGSQQTYNGGQSYTITGQAVQALPMHLRFSASANYFSSLVAQQRYQQNIINATQRNRTFGANLQGNWGADTVGISVDRNEVFSGVGDSADSNVVGSSPRITYSRAEKKLGFLPVYFGDSAEIATLVRTDKAGDVVNDRGLTRFDLFPSVRFPFTKWPFLTFNSSMSFRETYWTQSLVDNVQTPVGINRHYFTFSSTITGPVLTRVFNTPKRRYAQKFKHVIEPVFTISRTSAINNRDGIVQLEAPDFVVGSATSLSYGVNNRFYAKKDSAREIVTISLTQTYYTDSNSALADQQYQSSFTAGLAPTHLSPIVMQVHVTPTPVIDTTFRTEYDTQVHAIRTIAANGGVTEGWVRASAGWSVSRYIPLLPGFDIETAATNALNASAIIKKPGNGFGGNYTFNYDLRQRSFLNQRYMAYYNTQCCGLIVEYQKFNYGGNAAIIGVRQDHRFNISFTLAGIGTFSDLFGSFGQQNR